MRTHGQPLIYSEVIDISEILFKILGVSADIATLVMFVDYAFEKIR